MLPGHHTPDWAETLPGLVSDYADISTQLEVAGIIRARLVKQADIRQVALQRISLSAVRRVIDLGCGTGYFTEGLVNRVAPGTTVTGIEVHPAYRELFLAACARVGVNGTFESRGIGMINSLVSGSFDLALCSYSLYFFPDSIPAIARLLGPGGRFVTITHGEPHMAELTGIVREVLSEEGIAGAGDLLYDSLISKFSGTNGKSLLAPAFKEVTRIKCKGRMEFRRQNLRELQRYIRLKAPFFLPPDLDEGPRLVDRITDRVSDRLEQLGTLRINKDDYIFVCSGPRHAMEK